jgi:integrase
MEKIFCVIVRKLSIQKEMKMELIPQNGYINDNIANIPILSKQVRTVDGRIADVNSNKWSVSPFRGEDFTINWDLLEGPNCDPVLSIRARHLAKLYIIHILSKKVWGTVREHFHTIVSFDHWLSTQHNSVSSLLSTKHGFDWNSLDERSVRAFQIWKSKQKSYAFLEVSHLRGLYAWGLARRYPDFSPDVLRLLRSIKVTHYPRGRNVRIRHPLNGPLTPDETQLISNAIKNSCGSDRDRAIIMLHLELGLNPYASTRLLNQHLKRYDKGEYLYYQIDIPRIKKRTVHLETKRRPLSKELGDLLMRLQRGAPNEALLYWLAPSEPVHAISSAMHRFVKAAELKSPRTGALLNLHPRRFRYTLATYMAEEGASKFHIAEVLDHTDLQCVNVYVETVSSISEHVAKATDPKLEPVVGRFLGKIVDSPINAPFTENSSTIVPSAIPHLPLLLNLGGVGMCGRDVRKDGLCRLFPPLSCYLCPSFAALRSGPHKELLESINAFIVEMEGIFDKRILSQLDNIRLALKEVIDQLQLDAEKAERYI